MDRSQNYIANKLEKKIVEFELAQCDLCRSTHNKLLYSMPDLRFKCYEVEYSVVECLNCGHRFLSPRPTIDSISFIYPPTYYADRNSSNAKQRERYLRQYQYLAHMEEGRILDVGCAGGEWLEMINDYGWECHGVDLVESPHYKDNADIDIRHGYLPELDYPISFFDVVCAWGVMEHVHEPSQYFKCINRILKEGGVFIFMVPNADSLWSRWAFKEDIPRHLHFFRAKTLHSYAQKYRFQIKTIEYTNRIYSRPATGRGLFRRRLLRKAGVSWEESVGSPQGFLLKALGRFGSVLDYCLIHPRLEEIFNWCGNMVVIFEKQ